MLSWLFSCSTEMKSLFVAARVPEPKLCWGMLGFVESTCLPTVLLMEYCPAPGTFCARFTKSYWNLLSLPICQLGADVLSPDTDAAIL